ncbi:MAG TPA: hypothetical protein VJ914_31490 [Pseudonocardiaceae bacterium]|nr:hypothetical protein [Pseudonocardiaceae bacterium]
MSWSRRSERLWCVLTVLAGLFAMHGLASPEAGGCHLSATMTSTAALPGLPIAMPDKPTPTPGQPTAMLDQPTPGLPVALPGLPAALPGQPIGMRGQPRHGQPTAAPAMRPMTGSMCLFVAPAGWPPLTLALLALVTLAALIGLGLAWAPSVSGRSPPDSGVSLLRRVCVSRT